MTINEFVKKYFTEKKMNVDDKTIEKLGEKFTEIARKGKVGNIGYIADEEIYEMLDDYKSLLVEEEKEEPKPKRGRKKKEVEPDMDSLFDTAEEEIDEDEEEVEEEVEETAEVGSLFDLLR